MYGNRPTAALSAISADDELLRRFAAAPFAGRVHSVFDRVVNIEPDRGGLVALACRGLDDAPDTAILDCADWAAAEVAAGDAVAFSDGQLHVGGTTVAFGAAARWNAWLAGYPDDDTALRANLRWVSARLPSLGGTAQDASVAGFGRGDPGREWAQALASRSQQLCAALARRDRTAALAHAHSLVGLGPGLTPSGDDFLVGLFAALHVVRSPGHALRGIGAEVVAASGDTTHAISRAALAHAARGRVRASIGEFIERLMHSTGDDKLQLSLDRVLSIGSSSGADIAAGVVAAFRVHLELADARAAAPPAPSGSGVERRLVALVRLSETGEP